jgi:hypothetical protein
VCDGALSQESACLLSLVDMLPKTRELHTAIHKSTPAECTAGRHHFMCWDWAHAHLEMIMKY